MKRLLPFLSVALLHAAPQEAEPAYDADLFRKDTSAYFINAEFLYWSANVGTLDYALKMDEPAWSSANVFANGLMERAKYNWDPGFRINLGYFRAPHLWDMLIEYTYFVNHGHNEVHRPKESSEFLNGTWPHPDPAAATVALDQAHSDIDLHYHYLDFVVTRRFHPNPHFRMRLAAGIPLVWLRQNWEIEYRDLNNQKSHIHNHWRFNGAGMEVILTLDWFLDWWNMYLVGRTSGALLAGQYHNVSKQTTTLSSSGTPIRNVHYHDTRLTMHWQFLGGPSWQKAFGSCRTELFVGYELNIWSNLQEIMRSTNGSPEAPKETWLNTGLVGFQGITARWNLDF